MIAELEKFFANARGRRVVATEFLRLGLKVDGKAKIYAGNIEIPPVKIGRALNVDRRVVIETAKAIAEDDKLLQIFYRLEPRAFIANAAKELGVDVIEIRANPKRKGVVAAVTRVLSDHGVNIRQIISDDPELYPDPVLTIIIQGKLDPQIIEQLKRLECAESIMIK